MSKSSTAVLWLVAIGLLSPGIVWFGSAASTWLSSETVNGTASRHERREKSKSSRPKSASFTTYYAFTYEGDSHEVAAFWGSNPPTPLGTTATVLVPNGAPEGAAIGGLDLWCCPSGCLFMGLLPIGLLILGRGVQEMDPETLAKGLGRVKPELAGIVAYQARKAALEKDPDTLYLEGMIHSIEPEEKNGVKGWVMLVEADDRIYVSESLPIDLTKLVAGEPVQVLVSAEDPERYVVDWFPLAERIQQDLPQS